MTTAARPTSFTNELYINGKFLGAATTTADLNPADESVLSDVANGSADDIAEAVQSSRAAFEGAWGAILAMLVAADVGKPVIQARMFDVPNAAATFRYYAGWADKITGRSVPNPGHQGRPTHSYSIREPLGVVGAIVPWNSPLMLSVWKIAASLSVGNTVVVKPPELAPLSILHLARLIDEAGFPAGTVNVVPGLGSVAGEALVRHPGVDKISFTGSTATGRHIGAVTGEAFKRVTLELGGKSPQIIFADADLNAAIQNSAIGLFANQGEVCVAGTRVLVHRSHYAAVVDGLADAARAQVTGDPFDPATTIGPIISAKQRDQVEAYIAKGTSEGARLAAGGQHPGKGFFVNPTIFADATNDMVIAREEIFGPVGTVIAFDDPEEALRLANDTQYGLAASIWTRDISQGLSMASKVKAGNVWVNGWGISDPTLPWGGYKTSGVGQELGWAGIASNTIEKVITVVL